MPIRINLLAEAKAEEEARRKDPVKRAFLVAVLLVVVALFWSSTLQFKIIIAKSEYNGLEAKWKSIKPEYDEVVAGQRAYLDTQEKLEALQRYTTNRFLWGTALNALPAVLANVKDVRLIRLKTEQVYTVTEEAKPAGTPIPKGPAAPPKEVSATESIRITLDAVDSGPQPGATNVNNFREAIAAVPFFQEHLKKTNGVQLTSLSAPTSSGDGSKPVVNFTVQCFFPEKVR